MGKKTLYLMHEETRYDDDTWLLNVPDGYEVSYESFPFNTKYDVLELEDIEAQVTRLEEHNELVPSVDLSSMIAERKGWIADEYERRRQEDIAAAQAINDRLENARKVLREAGELP